MENEENRRILDVDDEPAALQQYRQIFASSNAEGKAAQSPLIDVLEQALEREPVEKRVRSPYQLDCFTLKSSVDR